jgi:hypothetical protein
MGNRPTPQEPMEHFGAGMNTALEEDQRHGKGPRNRLVLLSLPCHSD